MKTAIVVFLCVALIESGISVRADDTPNQAAARAALEQKLYQLDHPAASPLSETNSAAAAAKAVESTTNKLGTVNTNAALSQTASASIPSSGSTFAPTISADNTSAQAAALAALKERMYELNHPETQLPSDTNAVATKAAIPTGAPAHAVSAAATPVTEMPAAETPTVRVPVATSAAVVPASVVPAVVTPAPKVSSATAATAVVPTRTQRATTFPFSSSGMTRPVNKLVTVAGTIYKNVEVERVVSDGIVISYIPAHGNWAMTKVPFRDLPPEIRRQYEK